MPQQVASSFGISQNGSGRYGAASHHDFDNPEKWVTVPNVPVLDEHELDGDDGHAVGRVDRAVLNEIAANNNRRVLETGDPAPLIVGHTSDDPQATERPVVGYAVNYRVKPFKRGPDGQTIYAVHTDYKVRKKHESVIENFPRRSVELWLSRKELDPIALLGGTTPERDLGVIIRKSRGYLQSVALLGGSAPARDLGTILRYSRDNGSTLRYAMDTDEDTTPSRMSMNGDGCPPGHGRGAGFKTAKKLKYDDADLETGDLDHDDDNVEDDTDNIHGMEPEPDPATEDPVVAKVLQSKSFAAMLRQTFMSALEEFVAQEEGAGAGGGEGMDGMGGPPPAGADGLAPPPPGVGAGAPIDDGMGGGGEAPDEEARIDHEAPPVRMGASTGMGGPGSTYIPTGTTGKRYGRSSPQPTKPNQPIQRQRQETRPMPQQRSNPEVVRLSRVVKSQEDRIKELVLRNARAEAREAVSTLMHQGVIIADPDDEIEMLAAIRTEAGKKKHIDKIKQNYARRQPTDPASARAESFVPLSRYARLDNSPADGSGPEDDDDNENYQPKDGNEARVIADIQSGKIGGEKRTYAKAVKYLRKAQKAGKKVDVPRNGTFTPG